MNEDHVQITFFLNKLEVKFWTRIYDNVYIVILRIKRHFNKRNMEVSFNDFHALWKAFSIILTPVGIKGLVVSIY